MADSKTVDLFGIPDALIHSSAEPKKRAPRKKTSKKTEKPKISPLNPSLPDKSATGKPSTSSKRSKTNLTTPSNLPGQGFLPGLSRRGRPRLAQSISAVERTAEHRRKRIANGSKRVEIILERDVSQALDKLAEHFQEPKSDVIATLIRKAATRLKG